MPIPSVNELMGPVLEIIGDGKLHGRDEIMGKIVTKFGLGPADIEATVGDTSNSKLGNQIDWVRAYFTQYGIIETPERSHIRITDVGLKLLHNHLSEVSISFLNTYFDLEARAKRGSTAKFEAALAKVADVEPERED